MFEVGFWELSLIGVIALLVIGPERLPAAARTVGLYVGRIRRYVSHVRSDIEREINAEELRQMVENPTGSAGSDLGGLRDIVDDAKDALNTVRSDLQSAGRSADEAAQWTGSLEQPGIPEVKPSETLPGDMPAIPAASEAVQQADEQAMQQSEPMPQSAAPSEAQSEEASAPASGGLGSEGAPSPGPTAPGIADEASKRH